MNQPALPFKDRSMALYRAIDQAAHRGPFTACDVRELLKAAPLHPNDIGRAFQVAKSRGLIEPTGEFRRSSDKSARGRYVMVWRRKRTGYVDTNKREKEAKLDFEFEYAQDRAHNAEVEHAR